MKLFIYIIVAMLLIGCQCYDYYELPQSTNYGIVGDSIVVFGDECSDIGSLLSSIAGERITNYGVGGSILPDITLKYQELIYDIPTIDIIIVNGGANNIRKGYAAEAVVNLILSLFSTIQHDGKDFLFVMPYHFIGESSVLNPVVDAVDDALVGYCFEMNLNCLDVRLLFDSHIEYYIDSIHPSILGRKVLSELINDYLY